MILVLVIIKVEKQPLKQMLGSAMDDCFETAILCLIPAPPTVVVITILLLLKYTIPPPPPPSQNIQHAIFNIED